MRKLTFLWLGVCACASPGIPPGGPVDKSAPELTGISPDSTRTKISPQAVVFHFDEVVAERPSGATSLNQLFLISPRDGSPSVEWKRSDLTVRPRKGWKPNTTYVVTLLPGITDLRGNIRNTGARTFFSTGALTSTGQITGKVWDWATGTAARSAFVEAIRLPDSVSYIALSDSTGEFRVEHLPAGNFLVRGILDENRNRGLDPREAWDTVSVALTDRVSLELMVIARDSIAPTIRQVMADDSVTLRVTFDRPLDPSLIPAAADFTVRASDSAQIRVLSVALPAPDTSASSSKLPRPRPPDVLLVRLAAPLRPGGEYRISIAKLTGLARVSAPAVRTFTAPSLPLPNPPASLPPAAAPSTAPVKR